MVFLVGKCFFFLSWYLHRYGDCKQTGVADRSLPKCSSQSCMIMHIVLCFVMWKSRKMIMILNDYHVSHSHCPSSELHCMASQYLHHDGVFQSYVCCEIKVGELKRGWLLTGYLNITASQTENRQRKRYRQMENARYTYLKTDRDDENNYSNNTADYHM